MTNPNNWKRSYQTDRAFGPPPRPARMSVAAGTTRDNTTGEYFVFATYVHARFGRGRFVYATMGPDSILRVALDFDGTERTFPLQRTVGGEIVHDIEPHGTMFPTALRHKVSIPSVVADGHAPKVPVYYRVKKSGNIGRLIVRKGDRCVLKFDGELLARKIELKYVEQLSAEDMAAVDPGSEIASLGQYRRHEDVRSGRAVEEAQHRGALGESWRRSGQARQDELDHADNKFRRLSATDEGRAEIRATVKKLTDDLAAGKMSASTHKAGPGKRDGDDDGAVVTMGVGAERDDSPERPSSVLSW